MSAAVGAPGPDGQTPLHIAASRSSVDCLVAMVAASAKSARSGDLAQQLQHADALNARVTSTGATALMMAAKAGSVSCVLVQNMHGLTEAWLCVSGQGRCGAHCQRR